MTCGIVFSHIVQIFFSLLSSVSVLCSSSFDPLYPSVCLSTHQCVCVIAQAAFSFSGRRENWALAVSLSSFPFLLTVNCWIFSTEHLLCHCHFCSLYADRGPSEPIQSLFKETVHPKWKIVKNVLTLRPDGQDQIQIWSNLALHHFLTTGSSAVNVTIIHITAVHYLTSNEVKAACS